jgi:hypothetical protein
MNLGNVDFYKSTYQFLEICAYMDNSSQWILEIQITKNPYADF